MLLNGNRAVRLPLYRRAIEISALRYVETALYGNHVLRIPPNRKAFAISALHYIETVFWEYRIIGGLTVFFLQFR